MQNEFEKRVQHQMEQFEIVPEEAVWQKVEERIKKERRKRRALYCWLTGTILLILICGGYYISSERQEKPVLAETEISKLDNEKTRKDLDNRNETKTANNKVLPIDTLSRDEGTKVNTSSDSKNVQAENTKVDYLNNNKNNTQSDTYNKGVYRKTKYNHINASSNLKTVTTAANETTKNNIVFNKIEKAEDKALGKLSKLEDGIDTTTFNEAAKAATSTTSTNKDTVSTSSISKVVPSHIPKGTKNKIQFGVTQLTGISNNLHTLIGLPSARAFRDPNSVSSSASPNNYTYSPNNYNPSLSVGIGVFAEKMVGKKATLNLGVNYQLYAAKLSVGIKIDSSRTVSDPLLKKAAPLRSFYKLGQSNSYTNRYHLIEIPFNVHLTLNRNELKPLQLFGGATAGFIINSNALYYNPYQAIYYKEKDQLRNFQVGLQTGLMFTAVASSKYNLQLGPTVHYNTTNLSKSVVETKEHLLFFGLKTALLIKNKPK